MALFTGFHVNGQREEINYPFTNTLEKLRQEAA